MPRKPVETQDPEVILARMQTRHDRMLDQLDRLKEQVVLLEHLIIDQAGELTYVKHRLACDTIPSLASRVLALGAKERRKGSV